jgi:hypothetical protein
MLRAFGSDSAFGPNQDAGDSHSGASKFGPTVQAPSASRRAAAGIRLNITLVPAAPPRRLSARF